MSSPPSALSFVLKEKTAGMAGSQGDRLQAPPDAGETSGEARGGCGPALLDQHEGGRRCPQPHLCRRQVSGRLHQVTWQGKWCGVKVFHFSRSSLFRCNPARWISCRDVPMPFPPVPIPILIRGLCVLADTEYRSESSAFNEIKTSIMYFNSCLLIIQYGIDDIITVVWPGSG